MARMSLETAIRLSAEVKGGGNIDRVKKSLQDLGKNSQVTAREMQTLRAATFQFARANDSTIAGIRSSIGAFRGLQEQVKIGSREFQRYGAEIQKLEAKLKGLDGTAKVAGRSLGQQLATGLAAAGIGRGVQQITMQAGRFDAELRKAAAIEGGAGSFGVLREEIERVAAAAAGTPTEVAALATAMSRAGFTADQTAKSLRGIVLGAEATDTAFADMGGIVGTVLKTFQVDASQTSGIVDVLVKSANSANQTVLDVGEAMSYAAGQAATLGVDIKDTSALIALLADAGARGSRGGTAIATGLSRLQIAAGGADSEMQELIKGSAKMADAMARLNTSILDAQGNLKPMDQVLIAIKRQMENMSATDRAIIAKALFGADAGKAFQALLARSEKDIVSMFGKMRDASGTAEETREKMRGFNDSLVILGGAIENVTNQIGGMIGTALKPLIDGLNAALGAAAGLPEPIKAFGSGAAAAGITVLGLAVAVNALNASLALFGGASGIKAGIAGLLNFKAAAALATKAAAALNLAVLANPWVLAAAGIVAATVAAYKFIEPFREFVDTYPDRFRVFWGSIAADAQASFKRITDGFVAAGRFLEGVAKLIADDFATKFAWIRARASDALRAIGIDGEWLSGAMQGVSTAIGNMFSAAFDLIQSSWRQTVSNMINYSNPLTAMLKGLGIDVGAAATSALAYQPASSWQQSMFGGRATGAVPSAAAPLGATALPAIPAATMPSPTTTGGGTTGGGRGRSGDGGMRDQLRAAEQLREQQAAVEKQLDDYIAKRADAVVQLGFEEDLLRASTDVQRRQIQLEQEMNEINGRNLTAKNDLLAIEQEISRLGGVAETAAIRSRLEGEREQELVIARLKYEQDINKLIAERVRSAQSQAAEPAAFDMPQDVQIESNINRMAEELREMTSIATLATRSAEGIGNAFGNAFRDLITGAGSARQVLSGFFEDVAQSFADMAAEIIAKQMAMIALQTILKALGAVAGAAGGGSADFAPSDAGPFGAGGVSTALSFDPSQMVPRALGGPVSPGRPYPVGEQGPELFVPYQAGSIIPAEATEALQAINNASMRGLQVPFQGSSSSSSATLREVPFQRGMEGLAVPFQRGGDGGGGMGGGAGSIDVKFETVRIGELDFVTRDEAQRIGRESAKQGAELAQKRIRNNPSTRRQAGIG